MSDNLKKIVKIVNEITKSNDYKFEQIKIKKLAISVLDILCEYNNTNGYKFVLAIIHHLQDANFDILSVKSDKFNNTFKFKDFKIDDKQLKRIKEINNIIFKH